MSTQNRLFNYEKYIALLMLLMPFILIAFDNGIIRNSISNYVYMQHNQIYYGLLFTTSGMFMVNGAIWRKNYNILLGALLAGVALTPHLSYSILHNSLAAAFFEISCIVMVFYSTKKQLWYKVAAAIFINFALIGCILFNWYTLLVAEFLGILPITIHYLFESKNKLS
jgi:hypothetical protein